MKNITLNAGGFIGALLGAAIGVGLSFLLFPDNPVRHSETGQKLASFAVGGLIAGATGGNYLWGLLLKKS
jgi:hypothetical protein